MLKLKLFLLLLPFSTLLHAQLQFPIEAFGGEDAPREIFTLSDGSYAITNFGNFQLLDDDGSILIWSELYTNSLVRFTNTGDIVLHKTLNPKQQVGDISDVEELPNGALRFFFKADGCIPTKSKRYRLSAEGVLQDSLMLPLISPSIAGRFDNGDYLLRSKFRNLSRMTPTGDIQWSGNTDIPDVRTVYDALLLPEGDTILASCSKSILNAMTAIVYKIEPSHGEVVEADLAYPYAEAEMMTVERIGNDRFLGYSTRYDLLTIRFTSNLDTVTALYPGWELLDAVVNDTSIAALWLDEETYKVQHYDFDLQLHPESSFDLPADLFYRQLAFTPEGYLLAGYTHYGEDDPLGGSRYTFVQTYLADGTGGGEYSDAGLSAVEVEPPVVTYRPQTEDYEVTFPPITFEVSNPTIDPIEHFNVETAFPARKYFLCDRLNAQRFAQKYNTTIPPGETATVQWEGLTVLLDELPEQPLQVCFWTALPNGMLDSNIENDRQCTSFLLTSTEEPPTVDRSRLHLFPNPSNGPAQLEYQTAFGKQARVIVYNSLGQMVGQYALPAQESRIRLRCPEEAGLYVVALWVEGQVVAYEKWVTR